VIECDLARPGALIVTRVAASLQLSAVNVVGSVAAPAIALESFIEPLPSMAIRARELYVGTLQAELGIAAVVEADPAPRVGAVTTLAVPSIAPVVIVIDLVAGYAARVQLGAGVPARVAARTLDLLVAADQGKVRAAGVIEAGLSPALRSVAARAVVSVLAVVRVVEGVTGCATIGCVLVALTRVALVAIHPRVAAIQTKPGLIVVEACLGPARIVVALRVLTHAASVPIVFAVTRDALGRGLSMLGSSWVAAAAVCLAMGAR